MAWLNPARDRGRPERVGILFAQFASYHVDRCAAVARRLAGLAEVHAVEVATASATYAWAPSGEVAGAIKRTLFPGRSYDEIGLVQRWRAQFSALRHCDTVFVGIGYDQPDVVLLAIALRAVGCRVILMSDSKFDDMSRRLTRELAKAALLAPFHGALVAGSRQVAYMRFLGFRRRPVLTGYDAVDLERVRAESGAREGTWAERPFVYVGRMVEKKNLPFLLEAYQAYRQRAGERARRLVLVGGGELEPQIQEAIAALKLGDGVTITGFVGPREVAEQLAGGLALLLPSTVEQWGLVVNEALAFGLPVVVSEAVGARDRLVRNLVNGFVVEPDSIDGWAEAMVALGGDERLWRRMAERSRALATAGDVTHFAEAVARLAGLA